MNNFVVVVAEDGISYMKELRAVFITFTVLIISHFWSCMCIEDYGLRRAQKQNVEELQLEAGSSQNSKEE